MKIVRIINNIVVEIIPDAATPVEKWYNGDFARQCIEAPDEVQQGWYYDFEKKVFTENIPEIATPITPLEQLRADVDYIAIMTGVDL